MSKFSAKIKSKKVAEFDAKIVENYARIGEKSKVFLVIVARGQPCKNTCFPAGFQCFLRFQQIEKVKKHVKTICLIDALNTFRKYANLGSKIGLKRVPETV